MKMLFAVLFAVCFASRTISHLPASEKENDTSIEARIEALFARWNSSQSPGYAVGVVQEGKLVFAKGYGMANLEHGVPITPRTPFYIGSMSKQFTAACAALLLQQGKLKLTDDVHKYLPELPDYGHRLTIAHLIHHTGGVREWSSLVLFAGQDRRFEQSLDNDDVLALLARQKSLEFVPGSAFRYSSGGYTLLTKVIERASGQSLPEFAKKSLFEPLGMHDTFYEDNYAEIVPGRAESYRRVGENRFERLLKHFNLYGDGGVITTLEDMARWDAEFYDKRVGGKEFVDLLLTRGRLNSGEEIPYAFGLQFRQYKGYPDIEHNGFMLQFTADLVRFPHERLSVIVLGNTADRFATEMAYQVADLYLPPQNPESSARPGKSRLAALPETAALTPEQSKPFPGYYWNKGGNYYRRIVLKAGHLVLDSGEGTGGTRLAPIGAAKFALLNEENHPLEPAVSVSFQEDAAGNRRIVIETAGQKGGDVLDRYDPTPPRRLDELKPYVGKYYSAELETTYRFTIADGKFILHIGSGKPVTLFPPSENIIWNAKDMVWLGIGEVIFQKDAAGKVTGFHIGDQRVSAVHFTKIQQPSSLQRTKKTTSLRLAE